MLVLEGLDDRRVMGVGLYISILASAESCQH